MKQKSLLKPRSHRFWVNTFQGLWLTFLGKLSQKLKRPISLFDQTRRRRVLTNWCWYVYDRVVGKILMAHILKCRFIKRKLDQLPCKLCNLQIPPKIFRSSFSTSRHTVFKHNLAHCYGQRSWHGDNAAACHIGGPNSVSYSRLLG